jgi:AcrR family transcriptional regulator
MSISYEATGRTRQKARTRAALIAAAGRLVAGGHTPTVEEAGEEAGISRATAYRYFPNQWALLVAAYPEIDARTLLGDNAPSDPEHRLDLVVQELTRIVIEWEPQLRAMLRISLDPDASDELVLRQGRAIGWIEDALAPLDATMGRAERRRLTLAIRAACGIEAFVWLTDVAGLAREEAAELQRWSALALLRSALAERDPVTEVP